RAESGSGGRDCTNSADTDSVSTPTSDTAVEANIRPPNTSCCGLIRRAKKTRNTSDSLRIGTTTVAGAIANARYRNICAMQLHTPDMANQGADIGLSARTCRNWP